MRAADEYGTRLIAVFPKPCPGLCGHLSCQGVRYRRHVREIEASSRSESGPGRGEPPVGAVPSGTTSSPVEPAFFPRGVAPVLAPGVVPVETVSAVA